MVNKSEKCPPHNGRSQEPLRLWSEDMDLMAKVASPYPYRPLFFLVISASLQLKSNQKKNSCLSPGPISWQGISLGETHADKANIQANYIVPLYLLTNSTEATGPQSTRAAHKLERRRLINTYQPPQAHHTNTATLAAQHSVLPNLEGPQSVDIKCWVAQTR